MDHKNWYDIRIRSNMKAKTTYTIDGAIVAKIVALSKTERRSASGMAEMLLIEALDGRGIDTYHLINTGHEIDPAQLSLLEGGDE